MEAAYDILKGLARDNIVDSSRISVMGFSAGGQLAALFAARHPELFACILCYPLLDIADELEYVGSHLCPEESRLIMEKCFSRIGVSANTRSAWCRIDPIEQIGRSMPRTFIWHGVLDDLVRVTGSMNYANKLMKRGIRTELHIYDNCGHGISLGTKETAAVENEINDYCTVWFSQLIRWMEELKNEEK
jgi:acetyl esterase/lipase